MTFDASRFRTQYVAEGGSPLSANSYVSYLNRADRIVGGLDESIEASGGSDLILRLERLPDTVFGSARNRRDSLSATRSYVRLLPSGDEPKSKPTPKAPAQPSPVTPLVVFDAQVEDLLAEAQALGARYYQVMGRPLGLTGEIAELLAARLLGVELAAAREAGFDGLLTRRGGTLRVQIKGRAVDRSQPYRGRCPAIKVGGLFDIVLLVLIDRSTMQPIEIWEADESDIILKLNRPGSVARNERGSLAIAQFKGAGWSGAKAARLVWSNRICL